jgi:hypothetical protein
MRRRVFNLAPAVSLLLCLMAIGAWVGTRGTMQSAGFKTMRMVQEPQGSDFFDESVAVGLGRIWLLQFRGLCGEDEERVRTYPRVIGERSWYHQELMHSWFEEQLSLGHFGFYQNHLSWGPGGNAVRADVYTIPIWAVAGVFGVLPLARIIAIGIWRRKPDRCPTCSYNLTGNASGVCPECGTAVAGKEGA